MIFTTTVKTYLMYYAMFIFFLAQILCADAIPCSHSGVCLRDGGLVKGNIHLFVQLFITLGDHEEVDTPIYQKIT